VVSECLARSNDFTAFLVVGPKYPVAGTYRPVAVRDLGSRATEAPRSPKRSAGRDPRGNRAVQELASTAPLVRNRWLDWKRFSCAASAEEKLPSALTV